MISFFRSLAMSLLRFSMQANPLGLSLHSLYGMRNLTSLRNETVDLPTTSYLCVVNHKRPHIEGVSALECKQRDQWQLGGHGG